MVERGSLRLPWTSVATGHVLSKNIGTVFLFDFSFQRSDMGMANYKIDDIEGIGPVRRAKFTALGIKDSDRLLKATRTPKQRKDLAEKTGISPKWILRFANMADLYRVPGVGSEYAQLLEDAGVDTVVELAARVPGNLHGKLKQVNATSKQNTRQPPSLAEVTGWIAAAKSLPRVLEY